MEVRTVPSCPGASTVALAVSIPGSDSSSDSQGSARDRRNTYQE